MTKLLKLLIITLLFSCNRLEEGVVVEKWYEPASETISVLPIFLTNPDGSMYTMWIPYVVYDGEDYCMKIKGKYKGKDRTEVVYVSRSQYECTNINNLLKIGKDCSFEDPNNTKRKQ